MRGGAEERGRKSQAASALSMEPNTGLNLTSQNQESEAQLTVPPKCPI